MPQQKRHAQKQELLLASPQKWMISSKDFWGFLQKLTNNMRIIVVATLNRSEEIEPNFVGGEIWHPWIGETKQNQYSIKTDQRLAPAAAAARLGRGSMQQGQKAIKALAFADINLRTTSRAIKDGEYSRKRLDKLKDFAWII